MSQVPACSEGPPPGTLGARLLSALARACYNFPGLVLGVALLGMVAGLLLAARGLRFSTDRTNLLDPHQKVQQTWQQFRAEFGKTADFIVLIQGGSSAEREQAVQSLAHSLEAEPELFDSVFYRLDLPSLAEHGLYYLPVQQLRQMSAQLRDTREWLQLLTQPDGLGALLNRAAHLGSPEETAHQLSPVLPLLDRVLTQLARSLESLGRNRYQSPLGQYTPEVELTVGPVIPGQTRFYTQLPDGRTHVLVARARQRSGSYSGDIEALARLREIIATVMSRHPNLNTQLSGEPVINTDEMLGAQRDAVKSAVLGVVLINLLLTLSFGAILRPQMVVASLLVGLSWSFGFAALAVGTLNLVTVNFATILVGLGMTFGIHILCLYQEERSGGLRPFQALEKTLIAAGGENLVGALTTAVAFWALSFTSFSPAAQLGVITGTGVILCYLAMLTVLPSLLMLQDRLPRAGAPNPHADWLRSCELRLEGWTAGVLVLAAGLTIYSLTWINSIPFDYNLLNMQPEDSEAIRVEHYLEGVGYSTLYAISVASGPAEAQRLTALFRQLPTVSRVESVASFLPPLEQVKQPLVEQVVEEAQPLGLPSAPPVRHARDLLILAQQFRQMKASMDEALPLLEGSPSANLREQARQMGLLLQRLEADLKRMGPGEVEEGISHFERHLVADLKAQLGFLRAQKAQPPAILEEIPEALRTRSIAASGHICIRIFPHGDVWEREPLGRFVGQLQKVDPDVTGTPVLIYCYLDELRNAYSVSGRNALIVICVLLLLHFRSLRMAGLALVPKLMGVVWMIGVMGVCHTDFNAANFMALPLTLGIGLIFGVHVLQQSCRERSLFECSTGLAIVLSALTTIVGFSTLMTAQHRGIASLGFLMAVGVGTNLVTSVVVLPAILRAGRWGKRKQS